MCWLQKKARSTIPGDDLKPREMIAARVENGEVPSVLSKSPLSHEDVLNAGVGGFVPQSLIEKKDFFEYHTVRGNR
jgi:hypothetical protein